MSLPRQGLSFNSSANIHTVTLTNIKAADVASIERGNIFGIPTHI